MATQFNFKKSYTVDDFKEKVKARSLAVKEIVEKDKEGNITKQVSFFAWSPNKGDTGLVSKTLDKSKEVIISLVSWEANGEYPAGEGFLMHNAGGTAVTRFTL